MSLKPKSLTADKKHVSVWSCPLSLLPFDIYTCEREDLEKAVFYENEVSLTEETIETIMNRFPTFFDNKKINILGIDDLNNLYGIWEILA